ncbi:hypothetical protein NO263_03740 [Gluconacetobacter entanii]|uniref:HTH deoR-type domain-containing protein n=1 Tax=Gluconacetobacter entanii TaxID=108528 RepID=A0ABT3K2S3_9PROT|nr:hypothetical protein [Gluconacetobacter entanii]MCW4589688.1 hypothetical protein [Gluconacetobacter entanii]MCW4593529.1 hypothetical protein [Gluconacetobacter entanii]NPC90427.1 hypothetical protein [Gluconacetobacter entanii]
MLPKKGRKLPLWKGILGHRENYARAVAELLRSEHEEIHGVIKRVMRQTGASEKSVKHWLSAQHGPDTLYFLRLVVSSPVIRAFIFGLAGGPEANILIHLTGCSAHAAVREAYLLGLEASSRQTMPVRENDHENDPEDVPEHGPVNVPDDWELNERQRWFLLRLEQGNRCRARDITAAWNVSLKTARRDIGGLQKAQLVKYVGSRRKGRYCRKAET